MDKKNNFKIYLILLILLTILIHQVWFFDYGILNFGDWIFQYDNFSRNLLKNHSVWLSYRWIGTFFILAPNNLFYYLLFMTTNIGFSYDVAVRLIFLFPISICAPLGMFFLTKKFTNNNFSSFISAIFYSFNTFFLRLQLDWQTFAFVWAITPFTYLLYLKLYDSPSIKNSIYFAIISTISIAYEPRITIIIFGILAFDFIFRSILLEKSSIFKKISLFVIPMVLLIMLNSFWFLLSIASVEGVVYESPQKSLFVNFYNILNSFSVQHYTWCEHTVCESFKNNFPLPILLLFPLIAFSVLAIKKTNKKYFGNILLFSIVGLVGIFLSKQQGPPFGIVYEWSFYNLPLFNIYREASKFFIIQGFALSILAGYTLTTISSFFKNKKPFYFITILIVLLVFGQNWINVATGQVGGMFKSRTINPDYFEIRDNTLEYDYYRTMWIPNTNRFTYFNFNRPAIPLINTINSDWQEFSSFRSVNYNWPQGNQIMGILSNKFSNFLLDSSSIRYVVIPSDEYNETYRHYGPREYFESSTNNLKYLDRLDWNLTNVSVYENEDYYPHIYAPNTYYMTEIGNFNNLTNNYDNQGIDIIFNPENITTKDSSAYIPYYYKNTVGYYKISDKAKETAFNLKNLKVGDCNRYGNRTLEEISISLNESNQILEMTALDHIACVSFPFEKIDGIYKLTISYRTISGHPARFGVWQFGAKNLIRFDPEKNSEWQTKEYIFNPQNNTTSLGLFLYAQGNGKELTRVQYKDIKITQIPLDRPYEQIKEELQDFANQETRKLREQAPKDDKKYAFIFSENDFVKSNDKFFYKITDPFKGEQLIPVDLKQTPQLDIVFTENNTKLGDCHRYDQRTYEELKFSKQITNHSLKMTALDHMACIYFPFNYTTDATYVLNITYKGNNPSFTVRQGDSSLGHIRFPVEKSSEWTTQEYQFKIDPSTKTPSLGLFAPGLRDKLTENYYANISITEIQLNKKLAIERSQEVPEIEFTMINPTRYEVNITNASEPFVLVFGDAYHPEWKAFVSEKGKTVNWREALSVKSEKHFEANGWANGFAIENCKGECSITIYFRPQSYFYIGGIISLTTLTACVSYLIYDWKKQSFKKIYWKVKDYITDKTKFKYEYKKK